VSILAAEEPAKPIEPLTTLSGPNVVIQWAAPSDGGSAILSYSIKIRKHDGTYRPDLTYCDGTTEAVFTSLSCTIPVIYLKSQPFSIPWAGSVYAKV